MPTLLNTNLRLKLLFFMVNFVLLVDGFFWVLNLVANLCQHFVFLLLFLCVIELGRYEI